MLHKDLTHLSPDEIEKIMERYYNGEIATNLIAKYNLSVRASDFYKLFPPIKTNELCEYCGTQIVQKRLSRSAAKYGYKQQDLYCPSCLHKPHHPACRCPQCKDRERHLQELRMKQIRDCYSRNTPHVDFDLLPFELKVYTGALCSALCTENLCTIKPFADSDVVLAPTNEMQSEMYSTLIRNGVITISPESNLDAFVDDDTFPITYKVYRVEYQLNLAYPDDKKTLFDAILRPSYYTDAQKDDALCMWCQIATGECIEYLTHQLKQVGFLASKGSKFKPGQKTLKVFNLLLEHYSVAQIYYIIWKAVTETTRLYLEKGLSKQHAANAVISACERIGDRARLNGWDIPNYKRIKDLPQSALSSYFFDRVLEIGDLGFTLPPQL